MYVQDRKVATKAEKDTTPARYALLGNPVAHSKSPVIHKLFAHQFGHHIEYTALWVDTDGFADAVEQFRTEGGKGFNITVPFKLEAFRLTDNLSDRAKLAGAVNTIRFEPDGKIFGDNTDGTGLVHDLTKNLGVHLKDKKILVLGAGGAVRGALGPLLKQHPVLLVIANRTVSKAKELAKIFAPYGKVEALGYDELVGKRFDVVINGTSASLKGEMPPLPVNVIANNGVAYDLMYGDKPTPFLEWAMLHGAATAADGLGMLVEQAAESYLLWRGVRPDTRPVIQQLRKGV
ncbi:MAG: shikimate dehydrogenase [Gammaproteobacteria bacterium]|nr:shikimate dehydrogenase [Gammaproteobacteria bacterium]MDH3407185.1 shikimate dehydrogenase [Gammaproteobacteria bacterium]MDH5486597.1 shikimate dehydrogenase [Gammaproteobacteria bacterium]